MNEKPRVCEVFFCEKLLNPPLNKGKEGLFS